MRRKGHDLIEPGLGSPLEVAISQRDRGTMAMVEQALARNDAVLAFQPIIRADGQGVAFWEGLIRILDETGRIIPARDFMGAVEDRDLGRQIDCAALLAGLRTLHQHPTLRLSINMSARSVGYPKWMKILKGFLKYRPDVVERLILEITESSAMQMPEIVAIFMEELQDKGVTFALDDFGAGYTAFRHLKQFCFDILKIDGQFSRGVHEDADNQVLSEALISLGRHFDMLVVAEAVETQAEAQWLTQAGVDCMQGYLFGAPSLRPPWAQTADPTARRA
ncbi:Putative cyclic di-GMP phosphodiesterase, EAL domain protein [Roseibacterium elongatum DSM 19469]|uniref:Putative cyclic di-GMP phosphodiesterase, EAL domain protein n=1 Tax=Roseicyclus elongatus DSM 19469 TaxID=1294273 RepID=W8RRX2_9RHOB|nr:EAL domain-containing protein [Roseibacterium elongatum]AHM03863.1 Putative cyclic di-GMP phosphodiesterase, EAL domain protein [Roseibacterium elongatum DSM 19469]